MEIMENKKQKAKSKKHYERAKYGLRIDQEGSKKRPIKAAPEEHHHRFHSTL